MNRTKAMIAMLKAKGLTPDEIATELRLDTRVVIGLDKSITSATRKVRREYNRQ